MATEVPSDELNTLKAKVKAQDAHIEELQAAVAQIQGRACTSPSYFEVNEAIDQVVAITSEVFPGTCPEVVAVDDPEIENSRHFQVCVKVGADLEAAHMGYDIWHERLSEISECVRDLFRLSLDLRQ